MSTSPSLNDEDLFPNTKSRADAIERASWVLAVEKLHESLISETLSERPVNCVSLYVGEITILVLPELIIGTMLSSWSRSVPKGIRPRQQNTECSSESITSQPYFSTNLLYIPTFFPNLHSKSAGIAALTTPRIDLVLNSVRLLLGCRCTLRRGTPRDCGSRTLASLPQRRASSTLGRARRSKLPSNQLQAPIRSPGMPAEQRWKLPRYMQRWTFEPRKCTRRSKAVPPLP